MNLATSNENWKVLYSINPIYFCPSDFDVDDFLDPCIALMKMKAKKI
jgi:hypothetical protein